MIIYTGAGGRGITSLAEAQNYGMKEAIRICGERRQITMEHDNIIQAVIEKLGGVLRINLNTAKKLIAAIEEEAAKRGMKAVIAVCSPEGNPVAVHVMDGALIVSFDIAVKKAYTSAAVKMPTKELGELAMPGGPLYGIDKADGRLIIFGGGVPLFKKGVLVGGLGISGGTAREDEALAEYGLSVLEDCYDII